MRRCLIPEPEVRREIAVYFLATVFAYALGIAATAALATIEGPDEKAAETFAVKTFNLSDDQRKRLVVQEE